MADPNKNPRIFTPDKKDVKKEYTNEAISKMTNWGDKLISILAGLLAACLILYAGYVLYDTFYTHQSAGSTWDLLRYKPEVIMNGETPTSGGKVSDLSSINPDYRAWLTVYDTHIDYPVMQGENDLYYASHNVYKETSLTGAIYLAAANSRDLSDSYNLIYGHHMDSSAMFGSLDKFREQSYFDAHRDAVIVGESGLYDIKFFAVVETDAYESKIYSVGDRKDSVLSFIADSVGGTGSTKTIIYNDDVLTDAGNPVEKVVALSTCASASTNGRLVVFGVMQKRPALTITVTAYDKQYDGQPHGISVTPNIVDGTTIEYSLVGGDEATDWTTTAPTVTNVTADSANAITPVTVYVRASNPINGTATASSTITIRYREVTVTAKPITRPYLTRDGEYEATVEGTLPGDESKIVYQIKKDYDDQSSTTGNAQSPFNYGSSRRLVAAIGDDAMFLLAEAVTTYDEPVGVYTGVIIPYGDEYQENYHVKYIPATLTVTAGTLTLTGTGYTGTYDGNSHAASATVTGVSDTSVTVVEYSIDGGNTWTTTPPSITNVGEYTVQIKATNPNYKTAETTVTLKVNTKAVTVKANNANKAYGDADPAFTAQVSGALNNSDISYTIARTNPTQNNAGTYTGVIVPSGAATQGNYSVTYVPADFEIKKATGLTVSANGYTGEYDGNTHSVSAVPSITNGTTVEYSTDGGSTWTTTAPSLKNVGTENVKVRATNPNYETAEDTATLQITRKDVTVTANNASKTYGEADPAFTATVSGTLNGDSVSYTVSNNASGTAVGTYPGALVPSGSVYQGNYHVIYKNGDLEIVKAGTLTVSVTDYTGTYDGQPHGVGVSTNVPTGSTIEYSTDGGNTWTTTPPTYTDAGDHTITVRVSNPDYDTVVKTGTVSIKRAEATVKVNNVSKAYGAADPVFTATVSGVLEGDSLSYTIRNTAAAVVSGAYPGSLIATGAENQGNYHVTYLPGDLEITKSDGLVITTTDYSGTYDGQPHSGGVSVNHPDGTTVEYSTDGGKTWTTTPPTITDAGTVTVTVRATNPDYDPYETTYTMTVNPAPVVVTVNKVTKTYGTDDPQYTATVSGVTDGTVIEYTISNTATSDNVGTYPGAIVATGESRQGNYAVTYVSGDYEITKAPADPPAVTSYDGPYDGTAHTVTVDPGSVPEGSTIEYSTDGGQTWTTTPPTQTNVGGSTVTVRVTNPNYETTETTVDLRVTPKTIFVTVDGGTKAVGQPDPVFTATVTGLVGNDQVNYTVTRPGAGTQEAAGTYQGAIIVTGEANQGNYALVFIPGTMVITAAPAPGPDNPDNPPVDPTVIDNPDTPLARFIKTFEPEGISYGSRAWALVNLICVIVTLYLFMPLLHLKAKYNRGKLMKKINEEKKTLQKLEKSKLEARLAAEQEIINQVAVEDREYGADKTAPVTDEEFGEAVEKLFYKVKSFIRRARIGTGLELLISIASVVAFILTENMRLPMILIDKWTPLMLVLMSLCWIVDVRLIRYRQGSLSEEEERLREQIARLEAAEA